MVYWHLMLRVASVAFTYRNLTRSDKIPPPSGPAGPPINRHINNELASGGLLIHKDVATH